MLVLKGQIECKPGINKSVADSELCSCVLGVYGASLIVEWSVLFGKTVGTKCITV